MISNDAYYDIYEKEIQNFSDSINMKFKWNPDYFTERFPLSIYRNGNTYYFQIQHEVVGFNHYSFCEYDKITTDNISEMGLMAQKLLNRFHEISDFTEDGLEEMLTKNSNELKNGNNIQRLEFMDAKDPKKIESVYDHISIKYSIPDNKYTFILLWYKKRSIGNCSDSTGEPGILTFDTPLEFTDYSDAEMLGKIIVEALDRCRKITDKVAGNPYPEKNIELLSGAKLIVSSPRDKHFADNDDYGVGELYQAYMYLPREDSDESSAAFYVGMAAELNGEINEENIRRAWEKQNGKAEFFEIKPTEHGIWKLRAEMRNKSIHRISYLLQIDESELLDCTMELRKPNTRKKLDEKLTVMFEEFARQCKFKD